MLIHLENQADLGRCHSTFPPNKWRDCNEFWRLMNAICKRHMPPTFTLLFLVLKSWNQELEGIYHFIRFRLVSKIWGKWWENVSIFSQKLFDCFCKPVATGTRSDNLNDTLPYLSRPANLQNLSKTKCWESFLSSTSTIFPVSWHRVRVTAKSVSRNR